jgi:2-methylcitrate dehydratase PrpD
VAEPTLVERLGEFAVNARSGGVPSAVAGSVRQRILDIVGICAAAVSLETSQAALRFARSQGGVAEARAVGSPVLLPAGQAAFVNGVLAHSLDYDDTHLPSVLHPSSSIVPAVLAVAERTGTSGSDAVTAIAVGLEICVRLGMAGYDRRMRTSLFFERGQHATSICGTIGAAAGAALCSGLDANGVAHAMGIAASMGAGVIEANRTGGTVKRLHCGWAAHAGIAAADLAGAGFTGPPTVFEGRFGFFEAFLDGHFVAEEITDGLGEIWAVPGIFFKPYPANHFTHAIVDATARARADGLSPEELARAVVRVPSSVVRTIGEPLSVKRAPETGYQAQFSAPYVLAATLCGGSGLGLGLDDFTDELAQDPRRRRIMEVVDVVGDERCDAIFPWQFPAIVEFHTRSGAVVVAEQLVNRGGPEFPLTDSELATKFTENARRNFADPRVAAVRAAVDEIENATNVDRVIAPFMGEEEE